MAIQNEIEKPVQYAGNGSTTNFPYGERVLDKGHLVVSIISAANPDGAITTDYTVTGVGDDAGVTVVMNTAPATGETLSINEDPPATQENPYEEGSKVPLETFEDDFDKQTKLNSVNKNNIRSLRRRAIQFPAIDSGSLDPVLPVASERANKLLAFSATGEPTVLVPGGEAPTDAGGISYNSTTVQAALGQGGLENLAALEAINYSTLTDRDTAQTLGFASAGDNGGNEWYWDATSIETPQRGDYRKAGGQTTEPGRWVAKVKDLAECRGALGDGINDDTAALAELLAKTPNAKGTLGRNYKITSQLTIPYRADRTTVRNLSLKPSGNFTAITNAVNATASTTLATSVRAGRRTITVASSTGMSVGDLIKIRSDRLWPFNNLGSITNGEVCKITDISGNDITLAIPLQCSYNATLETVTVTTKSPQVIDLDSVNVEFPVASTGIGIGIECDESTVSNCTVKNAGSTGISLVDSYGVSFIGCKLIDNFVTGLGYGIQINSSTQTSIAGCYFNGNRRGVDYSGGIPSHLGTVLGCTAIGNPSEGSVMGSHGGANQITFANNTLSGSPIGIMVRNPNTIIANNWIDGCVTCILVQGVPGFNIQGNQVGMNAMENIVGSVDSTDAFFLEINTTYGQNSDLFLLGQQINKVSNNVVTVLSDFIRLNAGITELKQTKVFGNNVCLSNNSSGSPTSFINAVSACTSEEDTVDITGNTVRNVSGAYVKYRNFAPGVINERVTGTPEGNLPGSVGSVAYREDGGAGTAMYVKESGTGSTGWVAK